MLLKGLQSFTGGHKCNIMYERASANRPGREETDDGENWPTRGGSNPNQVRFHEMRPET